MEYTTLGKTGLKVSVVGLGCGGFSRIGQRAGKSEAESVSLVQAAFDMGINFLDTARAYSTETIVGKAVKSYNLNEIVISTKAQIDRDNAPRPTDEILADLDQSLDQLGIDCIDIFHLHGVLPQLYDHAIQDIVPALLRQREKGKFRFLGITESPPRDPAHQTLERVLQDDYFSVIMVAFHMLHQSARHILQPALQRQIGTLIMFAVRVIFSQPERLRQAVAEQVQSGALPAWLADRQEPLDFLVHAGGASSLIDAAYRYCRHEPGADVVLVGTGAIDHLKNNVASILKPALPAVDLDRIRTLFGALQGVGLHAPKPTDPPMEKES